MGNKDLAMKMLARLLSTSASWTAKGSPTARGAAVRVIRPHSSPQAPSGTLMTLLEGLGSGRLVTVAVVGGIGCSSLLYLFVSRPDSTHGFYPAFPLAMSSPDSVSRTEDKKRKLTAREKRFIKFASVEYEGQIYMTPSDFLESVVEGEPRPRFKRQRLTAKEVQNMMYKLPKIHKNDPGFFRSLSNHGIISFSEYLFLLTILTKPQSGFKIAFSMLDRDGNERIDKEEFKVLEKVFSSAAKERKEQLPAPDPEGAASGSASEGASSPNGVSGSAALVGTMLDKFDDLDHGLHRTHNDQVNTTLLVYFFNQRGDGELKFDDFRRFMDNLQTEVLLMEYNEFSKGSATITEVDFARILLRYTFLHSEEYEMILDRLVRRLKAAASREEHSSAAVEGRHRLKGVTFEQFKDFCLFLNNLDDFQIAMRMYTLADKAITPEEFSRAVAVCTGKRLDPHVVRTVFQIFDEDGDGLLSYQEFIAMMKDRVHRGLKSYSRQEGWTGFKRCLKQEVRAGH